MGRRILAIVAHPDDLEYQAGGTVLRLIAGGDEIHQVSATLSQAASFTKSRAEVANSTRHEMQLVKNAMGYASFTSLGLKDGYLYDLNFNELRGMLIRKIRELRPDLVMTWYPNPPYIEYQDHIRVGQAAVEAAAYSELPLIEEGHLEEGLEPWYVKELCLFGQWFGARLPDVNAIIDITETIDKKIKSLWLYETQMILLGETVKREAIASGIPQSDIPLASLEDYRELVGNWVRSGAVAAGRKIDVPFAEQFVYRTTGPIREAMGDRLPRSFLLGL